MSIFTNQTSNCNMGHKVLLTSKEVNIILHRLACQLIEKHLDFTDALIIGIQPRGSFLAKRLCSILKNDYKIKGISLYLLYIPVANVWFMPATFSMI